MVHLALMNTEEFQEYLEIAIDSYAKENVISGNWKEVDSLNKSKKVYAELLPEGEKTENHYLFTIQANHQQVGIIWLGKVSDTTGYIYDFYILKKFRGHGYGKIAMNLIETEGKKLGFNKIGLHVFGHNLVARALYEKLGYEAININMFKEI